ncbi:MAG: acyl-CoA dehydrogenase, partial [Aeromicrobium sp.]|nr:acyl-CoA dehydrogenase [Aeromicrobium sp.]
MDFGFDDKTREVVERVEAFMDAEVYPAEPILKEQIEESVALDRWSFPPIVMELRAKAKAQGLWNFFDPHGDAALTNLQYAPIAEITGRSIQMAPAVFNCAAPDTGNMEVLEMFGTDQQKQQWLEPLLAGDIRSAFAMTEPQVASSDATNVEMSIVRDGDEYVINGRKWWITGAMNPDCKIFIVMGKTDPSADRHRQQSQILVERDTPGLEIVRGMHVFGYHDRDHGGHAEMRFTDVRVPASNIIGGEGEGFAIAQARLGPGRIHHCMRSLGIAERAIEMMSRRASER